jgi:hypothetical protein
MRNQMSYGPLITIYVCQQTMVVQKLKTLWSTAFAKVNELHHCRVKWLHWPSRKKPSERHVESIVS